MMKKQLYVILLLMLCAPVLSLGQQGENSGAKRGGAPLDRKEVRSGNRGFRKGHFKEAEIEYRRALVKDSLSVAGNYNLANTLYRMEDYQNAGKYIETAETAGKSDIFFNKGDIALQNKDYNTAVDAFKQALLLNPGDLDAKENYIYAKKMLEDQQQNQDQNQQNNQDQNQQNNQNQDNNDQNNQDNKDNQNQDDNQNQNNQDQNQDNQNQDQDRNQDQQPQEQQLSPQAAQQMLQAIEAKEKETQDKVKKEEALRMQSRQKEKNW